MATRNPLSKTRLKFTKDRIQHYSEDLYRCAPCGHQFYPKVHSQPYIVQFGAILVGLLIFTLFKTQAPAWMYALLPGVVAVYFIYYHKKDRKAVSRAGSSKIKYGDIILDCPQCGSAEVTGAGQ